MRDAIQYPLTRLGHHQRFKTMANLLIFNSVSATHSLPSTATRAFFKPPLGFKPSAIFLPGDPSRRRARGSTVVTRAGPSTNSYLFAFALPFSLLAITIFASIRIADKLDRDYLQEVRDVLWIPFSLNFTCFVAWELFWVTWVWVGLKVLDE